MIFVCVLSSYIVDSPDLLSQIFEVVPVCRDFVHLKAELNKPFLIEESIEPRIIMIGGKMG